MQKTWTRNMEKRATARLRDSSKANESPRTQNLHNFNCKDNATSARTMQDKWKTIAQENGIRKSSNSSKVWKKPWENADTCKTHARIMQQTYWNKSCKQRAQESALQNLQTPWVKCRNIAVKSKTHAKTMDSKHNQFQFDYQFSILLEF